jgi:hypothetical protein
VVPRDTPYGNHCCRGLFGHGKEAGVWNWHVLSMVLKCRMRLRFHLCGAVHTNRHRISLQLCRCVRWYKFKKMPLFALPCPPVRLHAVTREFLNEFPLSLILGSFAKICPTRSDFGQHRTKTVETYTKQNTLLCSRSVWLGIRAWVFASLPDSTHPGGNPLCWRQYAARLAPTQPSTLWIPEWHPLRYS